MNNNKETTTPPQPHRSRWSVFLDYTWRLWAALICLALAALSAWLVYLWASSDGRAGMRAGALVAPLYLVYHALRHLYYFVDGLIDLLIS